MATNLVLCRVDPMLARQITWHKSEKSFGRYSKRALEIEVERQFYDVFGQGYGGDRLGDNRTVFSDTFLKVDWPS